MSSTAPCEIRLGSLRIGARLPTRVMAVINASPESFHAGSVHATPDAVARAAERAATEGADVLDIGAMSTAPYKETQITAREETVRMVAAIKAARDACDLPITADTTRASVARAALDAGATGINDVSGLYDDSAMGRVIAEAQCAAVLMAREAPGAAPLDGSPVEATLEVLRGVLDRATRAGIARNRVILDPGIGFFRHQAVAWTDWDLALLRHLEKFLELGCPLLVGASRKSFIGALFDQPDPADRLPASLGVAAWSVLQGASVLRVHDVAETRDVVRMVELLRVRD